MTSDGSRLLHHPRRADDRRRPGHRHQRRHLPRRRRPASATLTRVSASRRRAGGAATPTPATRRRTTTNEHWNTVGVDRRLQRRRDRRRRRGRRRRAGHLLPLARAARRLRPGDRRSDAPNLYVDEPGPAPHFVATLESERRQGRYPEPQLHTGKWHVRLVRRTPTGWRLRRTATSTSSTSVTNRRRSSATAPFREPRSRFCAATASTAETTSPERSPSQIGVDPDHRRHLRRPTFANISSLQRDAATQLGTHRRRTSPQRDRGQQSISTTTVYVGLNYPQAGYIAVSTPDWRRSLDDLPGGPLSSAASPSIRPEVLRRDAEPDRGLNSPKGRLHPHGRPRVTPTGVAVDPANDDVYVDQGNRVLHFDSAGAVAGTVEVGNISSGSQLAVGANHRLYLIEGGQGGKVHYYDVSRAPDLAPTTRRSSMRSTTPAPATPKTSR